MSSKFRVGVVGAGSISQRGHIPGLQKVPDVEVVALCDTNRERARQVANITGIGRFYTDWREMFAAGMLDAVTIATPNAFHAEMTIAAMESGLHVFCEKPIATRVSDGEAMVATSKRTGKIFAVNMHMREVPAVAWMRHAVRVERLGAVRYAKAKLFQRAGIPGYGSWFTRRALSGGGVFMDIGVHMLDAVLWILDFPAIEAVRAEMQSIHGPKEQGLGGWGVEQFANGTFDVEDFASVYLSLAKGGLITVEVTWAVYGPNEMRIQLLGNDAGLDLNVDRYGNDTPLRLFSYENGSAVDSSPVLTHLEGSTWDVTIARFVAAMRGEDTISCTGEEGLRVLRILDAAYRSADKGCEISL